jgi:crotonobetainyl-CoA:carnitine CoA-transferase CaiB-like acyl-CoA transferase
MKTLVALMARRQTGKGQVVEGAVDRAGGSTMQSELESSLSAQISRANLVVVP